MIVFLYLFGKAFVWMMKVAVLVTYAIVCISAVVTIATVMFMVSVIEVLIEKARERN